MSRLSSLLRRGKGASAITGTLSGNGSLSIPQGVTSISLTGRGGNGGNNYWYNPGQAYIAPSGYNAGQPYIPPSYSWYSPYGYSEASGGTYNQGYPTSNPGPGAAPTSASDSKVVKWQRFDGTLYYVSIEVWYSQQTSAGQSYIAPYYTNPGQAYIAPSSGGGPYTGTSSTATLNSSTKTWVGGYDSGGVGPTTTQELISTGAGQSLSYSVASDGALSYSYEM